MEAGTLSQLTEVRGLEMEYPPFLLSNDACLCVSKTIIGQGATAGGSVLIASGAGTTKGAHFMTNGFVTVVSNSMIYTFSPQFLQHLVILFLRLRAELLRGPVECISGIRIALFIKRYFLNFNSAATPKSSGDAATTAGDVSLSTGGTLLS